MDWSTAFWSAARAEATFFFCRESETNTLVIECSGYEIRRNLENAEEKKRTSGFSPCLKKASSDFFSAFFSLVK
jgi:hypothetical protein